MSDNLDEQLLERFRDAAWMESGLSDNTLMSYRRDLQIFLGWLRQQAGFEGLVQVRRDEILSYLAFRLGVGFKHNSSARTLSCLRRFYRYLLRESLNATDPSMLFDNPNQAI